MERKEVSFPFINNTFVLAAIMEDNKMILEMRHLNGKGEVDNKMPITCIHTVVSTIPYQVFFAKINEDGFYEDLVMKHARATSEAEITIDSEENTDEERESEVNSSNQSCKLNIDEAFFALQSWVQGIAEAGINAFKLNFEIKNNASISVLDQLLGFVLRTEKEFLYQFIEKIHRECRYEGELHESSLLANYLNISKYLYDIKVIEYVYDQDVSINIVLKLNHDLLAHPRYCELFVKQKKLARNLESAVAAFISNTDAINYPEILDCFNDEKNFSALMHRKDFFEIDKKYHSDVIRNVFNTTNESVLWNIAENAEFCKYSEFSNLFDTDDNEVIIRLIKNKTAYTKFAKYYIRFFKCSDYTIIKEIINHPFMCNDFKEEFRKLFATTNSRMRQELVEADNLIDIYPNEYLEFFYDFDSNIHREFLKNPKISKYPQIAQMFSEKNRRKIFASESLTVADDIVAIYKFLNYSDIDEIIDDPRADEYALKRIASSSTYIYHISKFARLFEIAKNNHSLKVALLSNSHVMKKFGDQFAEIYDYDIYKDRYADICKENPSIKSHPLTRKYKNMDNDKMNETFDGYMSGKISQEDIDIQRFPIELRIKIAENPNLIENDEFEELFTDLSLRVKRSLALNPKIHLLEHSGRLFSSRDEQLRMNLFSNKELFKKHPIYYKDMLEVASDKILLHAAKIDYAVKQHSDIFLKSENKDVVKQAKETLKLIKEKKI